jgi:hypothetical protein
MLAEWTLSARAQVSDCASNREPARRERESRPAAPEANPTDVTRFTRVTARPRSAEPKVTKGTLRTGANVRLLLRRPRLGRDLPSGLNLHECSQWSDVSDCDLREPSGAARGAGWGEFNCVKACTEFVEVSLRAKESRVRHLANEILLWKWFREWWQFKQSPDSRGDGWCNNPLAVGDLRPLIALLREGVGSAPISR